MLPGWPAARPRSGTQLPPASPFGCKERQSTGNGIVKKLKRVSDCVGEVAMGRRPAAAANVDEITRTGIRSRSRPKPSRKWIDFLFVARGRTRRHEPLVNRVPTHIRLHRFDGRAASSRMRFDTG